MFDKSKNLPLLSSCFLMPPNSQYKILKFLYTQRNTWHLYVRNSPSFSSRYFRFVSHLQSPPPFCILPCHWLLLLNFSFKFFSCLVIRHFLRNFVSRLIIPSLDFYLLLVVIRFCTSFSSFLIFTMTECMPKARLKLIADFLGSSEVIITSQ